MSEIDEQLSLPSQVEVRLLAPNIIALRKVVPGWRDELIEISEKIGRYTQSGQTNHGTSDLYKNTYRSSNSFMISASDPLYGACLARFEEALVRVFHSGLLAYKGYNDALQVTHDSGYEMLRYEEGQCFGIHTDAILGSNAGFRQLSGLVYLNDDYEGGETYFPRQNLKFKAEAGDVLLFPSTFCYPHESLPVVKGTKYAVVTWFVAYPRQPTDTTEEEINGKAEVNGDGVEPLADERVRLHGSTRGGSPTGESEAFDRERPACVGGCVESSAEA